MGCRVPLKPTLVLLALLAGCTPEASNLLAGPDELEVVDSPKILGGPSGDAHCLRCHDGDDWEPDQPGVCLGCHDPVEGWASPVRPHDESTVEEWMDEEGLAAPSDGDDDDDWSTRCTDCHHPHRHQQIIADRSVVTMVDNGVSTGIAATTFSDATAAWLTDRLVGMILVPDRDRPELRFAIVGNDNENLRLCPEPGEVRAFDGGDAAAGCEVDLTAVVDPGARYAIVRAHYLRTTVAGVRVPDYDMTHDAFVVHEEPGTGLCEVCHTETGYYRSDGTSPRGPHELLTNCVICHQHKLGFAANADEH